VIDSIWVMSYDRLWVGEMVRFCTGMRGLERADVKSLTDESPPIFLVFLRTITWTFVTWASLRLLKDVISPKLFSIPSHLHTPTMRLYYMPWILFGLNTSNISKGHSISFSPPVISSMTGLISG
jgi:hypothetical protein